MSVDEWAASWSVRPDGEGGWYGTLRVPVGRTSITTEGRGKGASAEQAKAKALGRAATAATRLLNDPVLAAAMPPQARVAITAVKGLAAAAKSGQLGAAWRTIRGPGARRLAKVLGL